MKYFYLAVICGFNIFTACAGEIHNQGQNVTILDISTNSRGQVEIRVESSPAYYYVLYGRKNKTEDSLKPLSVFIGQPGTTVLTEALRAYPEENYVVKEFEMNNPEDLDNDGIDDVEELKDLGRLGPLNPAERVEIRNGAVCIQDRAMFERLSYKGADVGIDRHLGDLEFVKFYIVDTDTDHPKVYFMNTQTHRAHMTFARAIGLEGGFSGGRGRGGRGGAPGGWGGRPGGGSPGQMRGEIVYHPYATAPSGLPGVYRFEFEPNDSYSFEDVKMAYELLAKNMIFLENNWTYYPMPRALTRYNQEKNLYDDSRVAILLQEDIYAETNFMPLNVAEGYGLLRLMTLDELPNTRDIVLYETLPNELPRVGGIITTVPQTPLSHVNLRAIQDHVPNAYIRSANLIGSISDLMGKYVYYKVTDEEYEIREATSSEVEGHYHNMRPAEKYVPLRDLSVKTIKSLNEISFKESTAFGVKASNVAAMRSFGLPQDVIPAGYAIPFYFYDELMKHNGLYDRAKEIIENPGFLEDYNKQVTELNAFRHEIIHADVPKWMEDAFVKLQKSFPEGTFLRCRSSTNNEDLPGFSGAGLYDSKTYYTEEGSFSKTILEVYASLWNFRAFDERQFYRIDHLNTAMGVLVHPSFRDERVNGVAVSTDPLYQTRNTFYLNSQLGEDMVTNPNSLSVPEEILLDVNQTGPDGYTLIRSSNQVEDDEMLMSVGQLDELRSYITVIQEKFRELYEISPAEDFAIEIEYKITSEDHIAIKQARPWLVR